MVEQDVAEVLDIAGEEGRPRQENLTGDADHFMVVHLYATPGVILLKVYANVAVVTNTKKLV